MEVHGCVVAGGAALGSVGLLLMLAAFSLGTVPPLSYGVRYNIFNKYADVNNTFGPGRHIIGPWSRFLLFPATAQSVEFSNELRLPPLGVRYPALHTRTKEGLALHLEVALQYKLVKDKVGSLYEEFNLNYEGFFIGQIRDTLIRVAAEYEAFQLWEKRHEVGGNMQRTMNEVLSMTYAECWGMQLLVISLPPTFDRSIVNTQVVKQNISTMEFQQTATQIRAETKVVKAEFDKKVKIIKAAGKANYTLWTRTARAEARSKRLLTEASVLQTARRRLKLAAKDLLQYQTNLAMASLSNASFFYGFEEDSGVLLQQPAAKSESAAHRSGGQHEEVADVPDNETAKLRRLLSGGRLARTTELPMPPLWSSDFGHLGSEL